MRLEQERNQNESLLREKDRKIKEVLEENEILAKKIKKIAETSEEETKQKEALNLAIGDLRKEISGL